MEPLLVFSKQVISRSSTISGQEVDFFATPASNLVHIGATYGEVTLFFKDSNTYVDDSIAGGASTKVSNLTRVILRTLTQDEVKTIQRIQRALNNAKDSGVIINFDNTVEQYDVQGVLEVKDILRGDINVSDIDNSVTLVCGGDIDFTTLDAGDISVANDTFLFFDADDDNILKIESIADFVSAIAGEGLTATDGVLSTETSEHVIVDDIVVTNLSSEIGAAQGPKTYTAGTLIEDIVRDILTDYYVATIGLTGLKIQLESTTEDTFETEYTSLTSYTDVEVGRAVKVNGFNYIVNKPSQTQDTSVTFYQSGSTIQSGYADTSTSGTLTTSLQNEYHVQTTIPYKVSAIDNGGDSSVTITSGSRYIRWLYKVKVGALDTVSISSESEAQTLYDNLITTNAFDNITLKQDIETQGTQYTFTEGYYTWVIFPAAWDIDNIVQAGQPVLSDFEYKGDFDIDNGYVDNANKISYSFYVTTYERAFLDGENITVSFL